MNPKSNISIIFPLICMFTICGLHLAISHSANEQINVTQNELFKEQKFGDKDEENERGIKAILKGENHVETVLKNIHVKANKMFHLSPCEAPIPAIALSDEIHAAIRGLKIYFCGGIGQAVHGHRQTMWPLLEGDWPPSGWASYSDWMSIWQAKDFLFYVYAPWVFEEIRTKLGINGQELLAILINNHEKQANKFRLEFGAQEGKHFSLTLAENLDSYRTELRGFYNEVMNCIEDCTRLESGRKRKMLGLFRVIQKPEKGELQDNTFLLEEITKK